EEQDEKRDRQRQRLRLLEVLADRVVQFLVRAGETEFGDSQVRMRLLKLRDAVDQRMYPLERRVDAALQVELHELGVPVLRDLTGEAGAQVCHLRHRAQR